MGMGKQAAPIGDGGGSSHSYPSWVLEQMSEVASCPQSDLVDDELALGSGALDAVGLEDPVKTPFWITAASIRASRPHLPESRVVSEVIGASWFQPNPDIDVYPLVLYSGDVDTLETQELLDELDAEEFIQSLNMCNFLEP